MLGFGKKKVHTITGLDNYELPSFSVSVVGLLANLRDPDCSFSAIADELEVDPGLHVRVLKTVNSVAFGLSHKVSNIHHAVSLLGRARLESLVLTVAVRNNLENEKSPDWFDMRNFWKTAALRAALARGIAQRLHPETQAEAFTAGLLQDMAVPVLADSHASSYQGLYQDWNSAEDTPNLAELERRSLQFDHSKIGAQMARNWDFPTNLIEMINNHHNSGDTPGTPLAVRVVSLLKGNPDFPLEELAPRAELLYSLDQNLYRELAKRARDDAEELVEALQ